MNDSTWQNFKSELMFYWCGLQGKAVSLVQKYRLDRKLVIFELFVTFILPQSCFKQVNQVNGRLKKVCK